MSVCPGPAIPCAAPTITKMTADCSTSPVKAVKLTNNRKVIVVRFVLLKTKVLLMAKLTDIAIAVDRTLATISLSPKTCVSKRKPEKSMTLIEPPVMR